MKLVKKTVLIYSIIGIIVLGATLAYAISYRPVSLDDCVVLMDCVRGSERVGIGSGGHYRYLLNTHSDLRLRTLVKLEQGQSVSFYVMKSGYEKIFNSKQVGECVAVQLEADGTVMYTIDDYNQKITRDRWLIVAMFAGIIFVVGPIIIFAAFKHLNIYKTADSKKPKKLDKSEIK